MSQLPRAFLLVLVWNGWVLTGLAAASPTGAILDPLLTSDGSRVTSVEEWNARRRPELLELFRRHIYGRNAVDVPAGLSHEVQSTDEQALGGKAIGKRVKIRFAGPGGSGVLDLRLYLPKATTPPLGCFLLVVNRRRSIIDDAETIPSPFWPVEAIVSRGYATAAFHYADIAVDKGEAVFDSGVFKVYGPGKNRTVDSWGAIAAWAWGASRAIDFLVTEPTLAGRPLAVAGHSRGGKVALWCGANDARVSLTISNDSGTAGAALTRVSHGETTRDLMNHFPYWMAPDYQSYVDNLAALPVDQHELLALIAPRLTYVASASEDAHADPAAEFQSCVDAGKVYRLFGLEGVGSSEMPAVNAPRHTGSIGYHVRPGEHDLTIPDWNFFMDFADRHWRTSSNPLAKP